MSGVKLIRDNLGASHAKNFDPTKKIIELDYTLEEGQEDEIALTDKDNNTSSGVAFSSKTFQMTEDMIYKEGMQIDKVDSVKTAIKKLAIRMLEIDEVGIVGPEGPEGPEGPKGDGFEVFEIDYINNIEVDKQVTLVKFSVSSDILREYIDVMTSTYIELYYDINIKVVNNFTGQRELGVSNINTTGTFYIGADGYLSHNVGFATCDSNGAFKNSPYNINFAQNNIPVIEDGVFEFEIALDDTYIDGLSEAEMDILRDKTSVRTSAYVEFTSNNTSPLGNELIEYTEGGLLSELYTEGNYKIPVKYINLQLDIQNKRMFLPDNEYKFGNVDEAVLDNDVMPKIQVENYVISANMPIESDETFTGSSIDTQRINNIQTISEINAIKDTLSNLAGAAVSITGDPLPQQIPSTLDNATFIEVGSPTNIDILEVDSVNDHIIIKEASTFQYLTSVSLSNSSPQTKYLNFITRDVNTNEIYYSRYIPVHRDGSNVASIVSFEVTLPPSTVEILVRGADGPTDGDAGNTDLTLISWDTSLFKLGSTGGGSNTDESVKVSENDTTPGKLEDKIINGTNISIEVVDEGGNEKLQITSSTDAEVTPLIYCSGYAPPGSGPNGDDEITLDLTNNYTGVWEDFNFINNVGGFTLGDNASLGKHIVIPKDGTYIINTKTTVQCNQNNGDVNRVTMDIFKNTLSIPVDTNYRNNLNISSDPFFQTDSSYSTQAELQTGDVISFKFDKVGGDTSTPRLFNFNWSITEVGNNISTGADTKTVIQSALYYNLGNDICNPAEIVNIASVLSSSFMFKSPNGDVLVDIPTVKFDTFASGLSPIIPILDNTKIIKLSIRTGNVRVFDQNRNDKTGTAYLTLKLFELSSSSINDANHTLVASFDLADVFGSDNNSVVGGGQTSNSFVRFELTDLNGLYSVDSNKQYGFCLDGSVDINPPVSLNKVATIDTAILTVSYSGEVL